MRIFGIEIEKKTDVLAFTAFLLSAGGIISQIGFLAYITLRGPVIELFPPERILIRAHDLENLSNTWVRINSRMAYTNTGSAGQNVVISREVIRYALGAEIYEQSWQTFETFDFKQDDLVSIERKPANPVPINAGGALSHDTYFFPFRIFCAKGQTDCAEWKNYLKFAEFVEKAKNAGEIEFTLFGSIYGREDETVKCRIVIDDNVINHLRTRGWHAPSCRP